MAEPGKSRAKKGLKMREVSGDSQELMFVLGTWVTDSRSEQARSRLGGGGR